MGAGTVTGIGVLLDRGRWVFGGANECGAEGREGA
jgi:hypothetical protein